MVKFETQSDYLESTGGCKNDAFENGVFVTNRRQGGLTKTVKMTSLQTTHQNKSFAHIPIFHGTSLPMDLWTPPVESSIAVEDAVENRGPYRVFASRLF